MLHFQHSHTEQSNESLLNHTHQEFIIYYMLYII